MNPFEIGVVGAEALHAVMDRKTALKISRVVTGEERLFLYNPMWGRLGDGSQGPPGTYYHPSSRQISYFWNTFDQVLLRPELIDRFEDKNFEIVTMAGTTPLVNNEGIPDTKVASDHLPILFGLDLSDA